MRTIEINNYKMNISDVHSYVENNEVFQNIEFCDRRDADIKVIVKDRDSSNRRVQYTNYYKFVK